MSLVSSLSNIFNTGGGSNIKHISPKDFHTLLENKEPLFLLDVREPEELVSSLGKIKGAQNYPVGSLTSNIDKLKKNKNEHIIVICKSGMRAKTAAKLLDSSGFTNISILDGGMMMYRKMGY